MSNVLIGNSMMPLCSDTYYLKLAYEYASRSKDNSTQNGAVLVDPHTGLVVGSGWNDLHSTHLDNDERRQRPVKYEWTEHAERVAIFDAAKKGVSTDGLWLYCPWVACADCGRAIVFAGISRVVGHHHPAMDERPDWAKSIATADQMFKESGIPCDRIKELLNVETFFAGKTITV